MISVAFIDDDEILADVVCRLCERCGGVTMHAFGSGEEALKWLSHHPVDVIVMDFQMPVMNGIELIKKIRESGNMAPGIVFTGMEIENVLHESAVLGVGIFGYVQKDGSIISQIAALMELIVQASASEVAGEEDPPKKSVINRPN